MNQPATQVEVRPWTAAVRQWFFIADVIVILIFVVIGRASHHENVSLIGIAETGWPFLVGWLVTVLISVMLWRAPHQVWPSGVVIWMGTVVIAMILRTLSQQGTATAFIIVASITLALFLVGWRAVLAGFARREKVQ